MNFDELVAIDVHTHAEVSARLAPDEAEKAWLEARGKYFKYQPVHPTIPQMAAFYRERKMAFVVFTVDSEKEMGQRRITNEEVAELAAEHPDVAIPFASIDPARVLAARRVAHWPGVRVRFHPRHRVLSERSRTTCFFEDRRGGLPALFHTGRHRRRVPGGGGIRLKYANPIYLDDVAVDFPDMPIVMAHPSVPWQDEALSVATHKPQVYIDLSGWSPKYFPSQLVQYANTLLKHKVLFGTDYPLFTPERWIADFDKLPIKPEVRPLIMKENAAKLLGLKRG
jgi:predicted TIM-barrel fold metal-dependent hydrolase